MRIFRILFYLFLFHIAFILWCVGAIVLNTILLQFTGAM